MSLRRNQEEILKLHIRIRRSWRDSCVGIRLEECNSAEGDLEPRKVDTKAYLNRDLVKRILNRAGESLPRVPPPKGMKASFIACVGDSQRSGLKLQKVSGARHDPP